MEAGKAAARVVSILEDAGFEAFLVGGCVRDHLLGRPCDDEDVTTSALASEVHGALEPAGARVFDTGVKHGTVTVVFPELPDEHIEVTTYRVDGPYRDSRHPESVSFTRNLEDDLARRDFTINALAWNPRRGLVDLYGGRADLEAGLIRCVGDPDRRFQEDALRIMRGLRFSAQLGFALEEGTLAAMRRNAGLLTRISGERIGTEFTKLLCGTDVKRVLLDYTDIIGVVLPQIPPMKGFQQNNAHHVYDVLEHTAVAVQTVPPVPVLRYAALLHDTGKPGTYHEDADGVGHFYRHELRSVPLAHEVCRTCRLPRAWEDEICTIVKFHGAGLQPTEKSMRRWLNRLGERTLRDLLWMKRADVTALAPQYRDAAAIFDQMEGIVDELLAQDACFQMKDLAVKGGDIIALGVEPGPRVGEVLHWLLDQVIDGEVPNEPDALLALAKGRLEG